MMDMDIEALDALTPIAEPENDEYGAGKGHHICGATWFGFNIEHCTVCHQTFSGETTGKAHRIGPHDPPGRRRCRIPAELTALGLWIETNQYGTDVWHGNPNKKGIQKRHPKKAAS